MFFLNLNTRFAGQLHESQRSNKNIYGRPIGVKTEPNYPADIRSESVYYPNLFNSERIITGHGSG